MKTFLFALALEFFFDYFPPDTPIEQYPYASEFKSRLKEKGWDFCAWEGKKNDNLKVFWNLGPRMSDFDLASVPKEKLVLFVWEPPTVQGELHDPKTLALFGKVFTWDDDLIDNKRFFKFYYPVLVQRMENIPPFEKKKFCTMISRRLSSSHPKQLYAEREKTIRFFEDKPGEFDLYGMYWEKRKFKNWRGSVPDKMAVLKDYKFSICYENTKEIKGYITEKIFDCFGAGVVPVYWGASNVEEYIPADCFIDRRKFKDNKEMYKFLKGITKEQYEGYLKAAAAFIKSDKAKVFSGDHFIQTFMKIVE
jgi:hypothetical protein